MNNLKIGLPFFDSADPVPDGRPRCRTFQWEWDEQRILEPLGRVIRSFLDKNPELDPGTAHVAVDALPALTGIILQVDDGTWREGGFWPTSPWAECG